MEVLVESNQLISVKKELVNPQKFDNNFSPKTIILSFMTKDFYKKKRLFFTASTH